MQRRKLGSTALAALVAAGLATVGLALPVDAASAAPGSAKPPALFEVGPAIASDAGSVRATRSVDVDAAVLRPERPVVASLDLFATDRVVDLEPTPSGAAGWSAWTGSVVGDDTSTVTVVRRRDDVAGTISTATGSYRIRTVASGEQVAELLGTFPDGPDTLAIPDDALSDDPSATDGAAAGDDAPPTAADDAPVIDVLVGYTPAAVTAAGSLAALQSEAALAIATTNTAYANSGVVGSVRLAGVQAVTTNFSLSSASLNQLTSTNDGVDDAIHSTRNAVSADLVSVLVNDPSSCGLAWVRNALGTTNAAYGFSLVNYSCAVSNYSFPHELGHNMGLNHDHYSSTEGGELFPYAYGHVNTAGRWRTIMSYNDQCAAAGFNCTRLGRFSNPDQTYGGAPLGVAVGAAEAADNRQALDLSLPSMVGYRIPNRAPVATAQSVTAKHKVAKAITLAGTDPDGNTLTYAVTSTPAHGTVTGTAPNVTYTSAWGYVGSDSFTFSVSDGTLLATGTVSLTVTNATPAATNASVAVTYQTAKAITLAGTDADGNALTYAVTSTPAHGTVAGTAPNVTYTPASGWSGPDSFTFTASDGQASSTGTISLTVAPKPNEAPTATSQSVSAKHRVGKAITLAGTDPDGTALTFTVTGSPAHGTLTGTAPDLTYTSAMGYVGPDSFTFSVSDGSLSASGTVSITITNTAPTVVDSVLTTPYGTSKAVTLFGSDPDGNTIAFVVTSNPAHGTITGTAPDVTYTPAAGYAGADSFTFTVSDGAASTTGTASIVVGAWWTPWTSGRAAVDDLWTWTTGVAPTSAERTAALASLGAGTQTLGGLVAALRLGTDATTKVDPATRLYAAYFVRIPDAGGLTYWIGKRRKGATLATISSAFAASNEFTTRSGKLGNQAFVELVYRNVLGREGDAGGIASWTKKLDKGTKTRGEVMVGFSESNEYKTGQVEEVHAAVVHVQLLGRAPTTAERDAFVARLVAGDPLATVVADLLAGPAVAARAR